MIRFLRLFLIFRDLEETLEACRSSREQVKDELRAEVEARIATERELESANSAFQVEQARRISAEAIAAERQAEIERLLASTREMRDDLVRVTGERIKSVDAINLKLMEAKIPEQPVDFKLHHSATLKPLSQLVTNIRQAHHAVDMALIEKMKKGGFPRRHMNEKVGVVPTLAEIAKTDLTEGVA